MLSKEFQALRWQTSDTSLQIDRDELFTPQPRRSSSLGKTRQIILNWFNKIKTTYSQMKPVHRKLILGSLYIASWYVTSISLSVYNKWLFSKEYHNFKFPVFTTCIHTTSHFIFSWLVLTFILPNWMPKVRTMG